MTLLFKRLEYGVTFQMAPSTRASSRGQDKDWHGAYKTQKERFEFLLDNEVLSDVSFVVGSGNNERKIPGKI